MKNSWNQRRKNDLTEKNVAFEFDLVKNKQTKATWANVDNSKEWEKQTKTMKNLWN